MRKKQGKMGRIWPPRGACRFASNAPRTTQSLLVVDDRELLADSCRRAGLRQRLAVGGRDEGALVHVLAVFFPGKIDAVRTLFRDDTGPALWPYRTRSGVVFA